MEEADGLGGSAFGSLGEDQLNAPKPASGLIEPMQWGGRGAAWNDYSGLSYEALRALKAAAGIELPSKKTILYLLAGYLLCLVPLNWMLFRIIGRLEFAWVAAPIMALAGVAVVTKVARLDIGFARRTTEISVLELHGGHSRGHLTQYLALYTSLSTNYAVDFPENDSVALPLGDVSRNVFRAAATTRNLRTNYGRSEGVTLEPLTVYSNSTEMVHAEQMVNLEGGLRLGTRAEDGSGPAAIKNDTGLEIRAALALRRTQDGQIEMAWIGDLPSGQSATLSFSPATTEKMWSNWEENPITRPTSNDDVGETSETDALWIGGVLRELVRKTPFVPGQTRLFAYTNDRTSQLTLSPEEDQFDGRCLVVAHLTPQTLGDIRPDVNIRSRRSTTQLDPSEAKELDSELQKFRPDDSIDKPEGEAEAEDASGGQDL